MGRGAAELMARKFGGIGLGGAGTGISSGEGNVPLSTAKAASDATPQAGDTPIVKKGPFKLKSGNSPLFKDIGSSPAKQMSTDKNPAWKQYTKVKNKPIKPSKNKDQGVIYSSKFSKMGLIEQTRHLGPPEKACPTCYDAKKGEFKQEQPPKTKTKPFGQDIIRDIRNSKKRADSLRKKQ